MSSRSVILLLLLLSFGVCACAGTGASKRGQQEPFDPMTIQDDDILQEYPYPEAPGSVLSPPTTGPEASGETTPPQQLVPPPADDQQVQGYRVQILMSQDRAEAEEMKTKASASFRARVYVDFEPPWYKVRVGDYETEDDARGMLEEINERSYQWRELKPLVVRTYIWK